MRLLVYACLICLATASILNAAEDEKPGIMQRTLRSAQFWKRGERVTSEKQVRGLSLRLQLSPMPVNLSENRKVQVTLTVENKSRQPKSLEFTTSQRADALLTDINGKKIERWSEDQVFAQETGLLQLNPGEHADYNMSLPTRELDAGKTYVIEAFIVGYDKLRVSQTFVPEK